MSMSDGSHPIWDQEVDGLPTQGGSRIPPASLKFALESKGVGHVDWMRPIRAADPYSFSIGVLAPIFCLVLDPVIFRGGDEHGPILGQYWVFFYSFIGLEILTLTLWLSGHEHLGGCSGVVAGVLWAGSLLALGIGILILPLTLVGLFFIIGILGFIPWLVAYIYLQNGKLALRSARSRWSRRRVAASLVLGISIAIGLPGSVQCGVDRAWREAVSDIADGDASAIQRAKFWFPFVDPGGEDHLLEPAIEREQDPMRKQRLLEARGEL